MKNRFIPIYPNFWLFLAVLFKVCLLLFFISYGFDEVYYPGFLGAYANDTNGYLIPIESFLNNGYYEPFERMPGYGIVFGFFSLFFEKAFALNSVIFFQAVLSGIAVYCLAYIGELITCSRIIFFGTYFFSLFSTYINWYDSYLLTESLSVSILVISVFFYLKSFEANEVNINYLFISGLMFTWCVFLRPVFLPLAILFLIHLILKHKVPLIKKAQYFLIFIITFLVLDSFWIYSGFKRFGKIIPLQESFLGSNQSNVFFEPPFRFVQSWGGNYLWWEPGAHIRYFGVSHDSLYYFDKDNIKFPTAIFTSKFNLDSLEKLRNELLFLKLDSNRISKAEFNSRSDMIYEKFNIYTNSVKEEKPKLFWIDSRVDLIWQFLFLSKTRNPFYNIEFPFKQNFISLKSYAYIFTLLCGYLASIILFFFFRKNPSIVLVSGIVWYIFLIHPIILRVIENRYLLPSYPFLILSMVLAGFFVFKYLKFGKSLSYSGHSPA